MSVLSANSIVLPVMMRIQVCFVSFLIVLLLFGFLIYSRLLLHFCLATGCLTSGSNNYHKLTFMDAAWHGTAAERWPSVQQQQQQ